MSNVVNPPDPPTMGLSGDALSHVMLGSELEDCRRWHLLSRIYKLPHRAGVAMCAFNQWALVTWSDAWAQNEALRPLPPALNPRSIGWISFLTGGARHMASVFDLSPNRMAEFISVAHYVSDSELSKEDARDMRGLVELHGLKTDPIIEAIRGSGMSHAGWWLESHRKVLYRPKTLAKPRGFRRDSQEPVRFSDLVMTDRHQRFGRLQ